MCFPSSHIRRLTHFWCCFLVCQTALICFRQASHVTSLQVWVAIHCLGVLQASKPYDFSIDPAEAMVPNILNSSQTQQASIAAGHAIARPNSSFVMSSSQLLGNTALGAGGGVFATSPFDVFLQCEDTGISSGGSANFFCVVSYPAAHLCCPCSSPLLPLLPTVVNGAHSCQCCPLHSMLSAAHCCPLLLPCPVAQSGLHGKGTISLPCKQQLVHSTTATCFCILQH